MKLIDELETVLQAERHALLQGDFDALETLLPRKQSLATRLAENKPDLSSHAYQELKAKAEQNDALIKSAQRGLKAAVTQFGEIRDGAEQKTYSQSGERRPLSKSGSSFTQKI